MTTTSQPAPRLSLTPVLLVQFIGMLGYSLVMPFLIFLVEKFGGNGFIYGIVGAMYPAFQLIGAPILGRLSDSWGRKRVLFLSQGGTLIAWMLFIIALSIPTTVLSEVNSSLTGSFLLTLPLVFLFIARALDGLTGGNISVANAYVSDVSTEENRKANFGKMAMASSLGFMIGPALAGVLGSSPMEEMLPVMVAAGVSLVALILIQTQMPESHAQPLDPNEQAFSIRKVFHVEQKECYEREHCPDTGFKGVLSIPGIPLLFAVYFLTFLGFSFFQSSFPVFASNQLNWTTLDLGIFFTLISSMLIAVQGPLLSYLSTRIQDIHLILIGSLLLAFCFFLLTRGSSFWVYTSALFYALGNGLMWPSFLSLLSKAGEKSIQGTIQGYGESMGSTGSILGMVLGGLFYEWIGSEVFWIASGLLALVALLAIRILFSKAS